MRRKLRWLGAGLLVLGGLGAYAEDAGPGGPSGNPTTVPAARGAGPTTQPTGGHTFPESWIGHWKGPATYGDGQKSTPFTMELIVAPDKPSDNGTLRYRWTIVYDGPQGRQTRPYTLLVKDAGTGKFAIDEHNGIVLDARLLDGTLISHFLIQGNRIVTRERLEDAGAPDERITVEMVTTREVDAAKTGGKSGVPEVLSWTPVSIQKATLRRVKSDASDGKQDADSNRR